ncbi:hypothetical protein OG921_21070 [Aldersonia sp. NBC_00410]|uniref:hypothetical protein n=1 Tax=Aldersonia sp. NBC_00410 TaxID=2975954 RepID=UPI002255D98E|nr:hypothetical protein [Aldersonia sp. NBC_00410]MCX5045661.1 hypothetical protein [Aldersonia sp. NBC_00410]
MTTRPSRAGRYERYRAGRVARYAAQIERRAHSLPKWRTRRRRRILVGTNAAAIVLLVILGIVACFVSYSEWTALLVTYPLIMSALIDGRLGIVTDRLADAPAELLDEFELAQRDSARSLGLQVLQWGFFIPGFFVLYTQLVGGDTSRSFTYGGWILMLAVFSLGTTLPTMILGWALPDSEPEPEQ